MFIFFSVYQQETSVQRV